jgi:hypothetical protein
VNGEVRPKKPLTEPTLLEMPEWLTEKFYREQIQPKLASSSRKTRVAIYSLRDRLHVLCDFTSNRGQLLSILEHYDTTSMTKRALVAPGDNHTPVVDIFAHAADGFENDAGAFRAGVVNGAD